MSASEMKYVEGLINKMKVIQKILPPSPPDFWALVQDSKHCPALAPLAAALPSS